MTAFLQILIHEIKNDKLRKELVNTFDRKMVLSYLLSGLKSEIEVEEFMISVDVASKLSWTHFSECMIMEALALFLEDMNSFQMLKTAHGIKTIMLKIEPIQNYYLVESMNFKHDDPFFYPTAYLISTLCKMLMSINDFSGRTPFD